MANLPLLGANVPNAFCALRTGTTGYYFDCENTSLGYCYPESDLEESRPKSCEQGNIPKNGPFYYANPCSFKTTRTDGSQGMSRCGCPDFDSKKNPELWEEYVVSACDIFEKLARRCDKEVTLTFFGSGGLLLEYRIVKHALAILKNNKKIHQVNLQFIDPEYGVNKLASDTYRMQNKIEHFLERLSNNPPIHLTYRFFSNAGACIDAKRRSHAVLGYDCYVVNDSSEEDLKHLINNMETNGEAYVVGHHEGGPNVTVPGFTKASGDDPSNLSQSVFQPKGRETSDSPCHLKHTRADISFRPKNRETGVSDSPIKGRYVSHHDSRRNSNSYSYAEDIKSGTSFRPNNRKTSAQDSSIKGRYVSHYDSRRNSNSYSYPRDIKSSTSFRPNNRKTSAQDSSVKGRYVLPYENGKKSWGSEYRAF